jgi:peptidoglycan hydrolase-like protein with peptidoglycan-binding domain
MHHKHHHLIIATYALLVLAAPLIWTNGAHAQTAVSCPHGYICTPILQTSNCPTGFQCTPATPTANTTFNNGYYYGGTSSTHGSVSSTPSACAFFGTDLTVGSRGGDVIALQQFLSARGYSMPATGYFGSITAANLAKYQSAHGIDEDGYFGPATRAQVNTECGSTTSNASVTPTTSNTSNASTAFPTPAFNSNLLLNASYQGMNASGPVYIFMASIANPNVASIRITLSCPANVSAVMKVSGDCNDDGALMNGQNVSWNGLLLNHTSSYQVITVNAKALSSSGSVVATAQTQVSIAPSPDWQGNSTQNHAPVSVSYPVAGMSYSAGDPISVAFLNPVLGTTYKVQLRGKAYSADLGTTYVGMATDQQKATFPMPSNIPADAGPFSVVIMIGTTDVASSPTFSIFIPAGTKGVNPSTGILSASCSAAPSGKDSYDLTWTAQVTGGTAPYTYSWSVYNDVSSYISGSTHSATFSAVYASPGVKQAVARISDGTGATVTASCSAATVAAKTTTVPAPTPAPVATASLLVVPNGVPSITSQRSTNGGTMFQATFNVSLQALNGDITIGLPGSTFPAVSNGIYTIYKNGEPTGLTGIVAYSQPSYTSVGTVINNSFVLKANNSVTMPVTVAFQTSGTSDSYSVSLNQLGWLTQDGKSAANLGGSNWTTSSLHEMGTPTPSAPAASSGPTTALLISLRTIKLGDLVTLLSNTTSPSSSLKSAAIDMSTDNANWTSGAPCGYWNSSTGTDSAHAITCNFTPEAAGTYYFRSRGTDSVGASDFVYQTLIVNAQ